MKKRAHKIRYANGWEKMAHVAGVASIPDNFRTALREYISESARAGGIEGTGSARDGVVAGVISGRLGLRSGWGKLRPGVKLTPLLAIALGIYERDGRLLYDLRAGCERWGVTSAQNAIHGVVRLLDAEGCDEVFDFTKAVPSSASPISLPWPTPKKKAPQKTRQVFATAELGPSLRHLPYEKYDAIIKAFYRTPEWKRARYDCLQRHGARCLACGSTPATGAVINIDHIKPLIDRWDLRLDRDAIQPLCAECNEGKGNRHANDWR